jgi:NTP pyrophosphatase (non-canonical NTP hydrolase)
MNDLIEHVLQWATDKGIFEHSSPRTQLRKFLEEAYEMREEVLKADVAKLRLELGDVLVTLVILARMHHLSLEECLSAAYNKIAKRSGRMVDGFFVKDA